MNILIDNISNTCSDASLASILNVCKRILNVIQIVGPILAIISLIIILTKYVINPDDKKQKNRIKNCLMALVLLFFVPMIVDAVMSLLDDTFSVTACWNYAEEVKSYDGVTFIETSSGSHHSIISDPNDYDPGDERQEGSGSLGQGTGGASSSYPGGSSSSSSGGSSGQTGLGNGMGRAKKITIKYNVKDSGGRCGTYANDKCAEIATVEYEKGTVKYYMGYQNNTKLLSGSCRSHAFTCGMNAINNSNYSTLDIQNYLYSTGDDGVLKGKSRFNKVINNFNVNATAYFNETSISQSISLAEQALDNGQPVMIFVANSKCSDLATTHHALLLLGYDDDDNVVFLDSCLRYPSAKKRTLQELGKCMSGDSIAKNYMRMVIFSF